MYICIAIIIGLAIYVDSYEPSIKPPIEVVINYEKECKSYALAMVNTDKNYRLLPFAENDDNFKIIELDSVTVGYKRFSVTTQMEVLSDKSTYADILEYTVIF